MFQIKLTDSTVDALVKTYEWYVKLLGGGMYEWYTQLFGEGTDSNIESKVRGAIDLALASLYTDCLQLEAENKRRETDQAATDQAGRAARQLHPRSR